VVVNAVSYVQYIVSAIVVMLVNLVLFVAMNGKSRKQGQSVSVLSNQRKKGYICYL
jgi:heme/copper-type cytochrome/quinol oxidase subunit 4